MDKKINGFISLFVLVPLLIVVTVAVTLSVSKTINREDGTANISEKIQVEESDSPTQDNIAKELADLKSKLSALEKSNGSSPIPSKQPTPKPTATLNTPTNTPAVQSDWKIELSASRYSLPANGEAISFITAEVRDKNGKIVESFSGQIEFQATAGVLVPTKVTAKNGSAHTELQSSTVPANLSITAQSGSIKSNSINLSFSTPQVASTPEPQQKLSISQNDLEAVVVLACDDVNGVGSGVIFASSGRILTNYHVTEGNPCDVYISSSFNQVAVKKYRAGIIASNQNLDVSVLQIIGDAYGKSVSGLNIPYIQAGSNTYPQVGDEIRLLGYPDFGRPTYYGKPTLTQGVISGEEGNYTKTDVKSSGGSSGGPVLDNQKRLLGIWVGIFRGSNDNIGRFLKVDAIKQWYPSIGL